MNKEIFFSLLVSGLFFLTNFSYSTQGEAAFIIINKTDRQIRVKVKKSSHGAWHQWNLPINKAKIFRNVSGQMARLNIRANGMEQKTWNNVSLPNKYKIYIIKKRSESNTFYKENIYQVGKMHWNLI